MIPTQKPLLIYDGNCGFCKFWIKRWKKNALNQMDVIPYQSFKSSFLSVDELKVSVHLIKPNGEVFKGAEAVFEALALNPKRSFGLWCYKHIPGFKWTSETVYRLVANHRVFFSKLTRLFFKK